MIIFIAKSKTMMFKIESSSNQSNLQLIEIIESYIFTKEWFVLWYNSMEKNIIFEVLTNNES